MNGRKLIACSLVLLCAMSRASAQKGTWIVDANGEHDRFTETLPGSNNRALSFSSFNVNTSVGYQFTKHFTAGLQGGYGMSNGDMRDFGTGNDMKFNVKNWHLGVFGRYTYWLNDRLFLYSQVSFNHFNSNIGSQPGGYTVMPYTHSGASYPSGPAGMEFKMFPAVGLNVIKGWGVHMDVGGVRGSFSNSDYVSYKHFNVDFGQQFTFGIQKIIGGKKPVVKIGTP